MGDVGNINNCVEVLELASQNIRSFKLSQGYPILSGLPLLRTLQFCVFAVKGRPKPFYIDLTL